MEETGTKRQKCVFKKTAIIFLVFSIKIFIFDNRSISWDACVDNDIMTIKEVAEYLRLKEKTAYHLASKSEIPGFKVGGAWRFRRSEIEKWIKNQEQKS